MAGPGPRRMIPHGRPGMRTDLSARRQFGKGAHRDKPVFIEHPWERRGIVQPGLPILPHGVERHPVPGGGSRAVPIYKGDGISVLDKEGLQPAELVFFAPDNSSDAGMLGASGQGRPAATIDTLANGSRSGAKVLKALATAGFDIETGMRSGSLPRDHIRRYGGIHRRMRRPANLRRAWRPMSPEAQDAPTEVILYLRRADPGQAKGALGPPDPLADPLQDINIQPGHASAYEVKAGEFIQILDVKGRECSDFQAFSRRALDKGLEREIDPTTTRSLMGSLYPNPRIFSKYWTVDHEPLVEIVQDTCGRHDTFGLALHCALLRGSRLSGAISIVRTT